jgi:hypothetical protein
VLILPASVLHQGKGERLVPILSLSHKHRHFGEEIWQAWGQDRWIPYLSGLARRQVKKHTRPRASMKRRKLMTAVRTMSRVGDRRAILEQIALRTSCYALSHQPWTPARKPWVSGCDLGLSLG